MTWSWYDTRDITQEGYTCGYCGKTVGSARGYLGRDMTLAGIQCYIHICPYCTKPTYFSDRSEKMPRARPGRDVSGITDPGVDALYTEARDCMSVGAHTAATLLCRKLLMNLAVHHGADEGKPFVTYIDYLATKGYVPPNGRPWVDKIRKTANEATHAIPAVDAHKASMILNFTEMLLKLSYEFPDMLSADDSTS